MKRSDVRGVLLCWLLVGLGTNCGVEVGNPHGGGGGTSKPTGAVSLALADAPTDNAQHVYLTLTKLSVIPVGDDGSNGTPVDVPLAASGKIDALALQNGKTLDLTAAQALPTGNYSGVVLELDPANPATIVPHDGPEQPLPFHAKGNRIVVAQQFTVSDGGTLSLVLHLDLRRSISGRGDKDSPFSFAPYASMNRPDREARIAGKVSATSATEVCAYLFRRDHDGDEGPLDHPKPPPGGFDPYGQPPPPPPGPGQPPPFGLPPDAVAAQPPPSFDPGQTFDPLSDTSTCDKAFATAAVTAGAFSLEHLWPGHYQLVFYKADGTRLSSSTTPVDADPGETVTNVTATDTGG